MSLENSLKKIRSFIVSRYGDNLAGLLVFGSANTGQFHEGRSDIDTIILLKKLNGLDLEKETNFLIESLKSENFRTQYFHTVESIKEHVKKRVSWSTRITILSKEGSRVLYSTPEFEKLKRWLIDNFPSKEDIMRYVIEKDKVELDGYFKEIENFDLTKALMSHVRRKLQIMNYFQSNKIIFDYDICLNDVELPAEEKGKLKELYRIYEKREKLSKKQISDYYNLARELTKRISTNPNI